MLTDQLQLRLTSTNATLTLQSNLYAYWLVMSNYNLNFQCWSCLGTKSALKIQVIKRSKQDLISAAVW